MPSIEEIAAKLRELADEIDPPAPRPEFALLPADASADILRRHAGVADPDGVVQRLKAFNYILVQLRNLDRKVTP